MQKITPFLWFGDKAEEAIHFYATLFPNAKIVGEQRMPDGSLMTATLDIGGERISVLNGAPPEAKFSDAMSLFVACEDQAEVDRLWAALTVDGGAESMCGWCKDKYGLSWQIIPNEMMAMFADPDQEKADRAMQAMLKMQKLDVAELRKAFEGTA